MRIVLNRNQEHIFILGAGSSVDYGLPTWLGLNALIKDKIENDKNNKYKYKKEILDWLDNIGDNKKYTTIDQCIASESVSKEYHKNGHEIENEIFIVMKEIFDEVYKENEEGWVRLLNEKIKNNDDLDLENKIFFINYNYDDVLDRNLLNFDYLPKKRVIFNDKVRLNALFDKSLGCLHPHGYFISEFSPNHLHKNTRTIKSGNKEYIDAVSCHESEMHHILLNQGDTKSRSLYILGLGGGLEINLNNIDFPDMISDIHITIRNKEMHNKTVKFLCDKFGVSLENIMIYNNCNELINSCFNNIF